MRSTAWILCGWLLSVASSAADDTLVPARGPRSAGIRSEQLTFLGYECRADCASHKAGYAWAERSGIANRDGCAGPEQSFVEGCRAYAESEGSSRDAGYDWAAENEVGDARACEGAGRSFAAGCLEYVGLSGSPTDTRSRRAPTARTASTRLPVAR
ncbi:MAG TPA: hypothetical protein VLD39_10395, partial [Gammaproteobacteria bacterium]|nr:hypothetical protein [Gammaproteobacteria bacterium]